MQKAFATPQIFLSGRIISATNFDADELFVKYEIMHGTNFKIIDGESKGETFQGVTRLDEPIVFFDHPLNVNFACRSVKGWPKILVEVWATDSHSRNHLIGYGVAFVPFNPGNNLVNIRCWRPKENKTVSFSEIFLGNTPEFVDKSAISSVDDKYGMFSLSTGIVSVEVDVIVKDFNLHGIKIKT
jgi:B9 domain-containing protein 2